MDKKILLICMFALLFNCESDMKKTTLLSAEIILQNQFIEKQKSSGHQQLTDSLLDRMINLRKEWFNSWSWNVKPLRTKDFILSIEKDLELKWEEYNPQDEYIKMFDSLLTYSGGGLALDMYSYNTLIEKEGINVFVEFDVDSKLYVVNKKKKERAEILIAGSCEIIEDGAWLDDDNIVLMGYLSEEKNIPFLRLVNIKEDKFVQYQYFNSFITQRKDYFFTKYPNMKLREE